MGGRRRQPVRKTTALGVRGGLFALGLLVLGAGLVWWWLGARGGLESAGANRAGDAQPAATVFRLEDESEVFAQYGGSASCRECHEEAYALWESSNHGLAERAIEEVVDRPAFDPARTFVVGTQATSTRWTAEGAQVTAIGLSGEDEVHRPDRVIGHDPLRQFLVPFAGGRWQTLEAAYDPATNEWFNVYGDEDRKPGEWGHWTGRGMNWNNMCAGCHNTRLRKNYDAASDSYRTVMAERTVGCEACHGPLKAHNEWQRLQGKSGQKDPTLPEWSRRRTMDTCGFCHARRSDLTGDFAPGEAFFDHQELVIADRSELYYPDGQVWDEDYEYASFLSSRMHHGGVVCLDCHDPHSMRTRLPGNWLCIRCHDGSYTNAPLIDPVAHSRHKVFGYSTNGVAEAFDLMAYDPKQIKETGGECVNCHMPQTVYMGRHWRHDHGFTIPDPLLTKQFGIPNACNRCHQDKTVDWAIEACDQWYSNRMDRVTRHRAQWLARAREDDPASLAPLVGMVTGEELGYWRAAAIEHLEPWVGEPSVAAALLGAIADDDPLVRSKAARLLEPLLDSSAAAEVRRVLQGALRDSTRSVRIRAAWALRAELDPGTLAASELLHSLRLNSDQPVGQMQMGAWQIARGEVGMAVEHYARAVRWDPNSAPIRHDYAVVLSEAGRTAEAIEELREAGRLAPGEAEYAYKLGLALNEAGDRAGTLAALEAASRLDPRHVRAAYNLGLALNAAGRTAEALAVLRRAEATDVADPRIPYAMATILANAGHIAAARSAAERAVWLAPGWVEAEQLLMNLDGR